MKWMKSLIEQYKGLPREIYIIFFSRIVNNMGCFVFPMLALILTQKIGITKDKAGVFITMVALLSAPGLMLGGKLVDSIGRKKVLIIFQGLAGLIFIICGFIEPSMKLAVVMMIAQFMLSISMPSNDSMLADLTTPQNRKEAFSLLYMGNNLGLALGPVIAGLLYKNHLNLVFIGDGIATLISLSLVYFFIDETINISKKEIKSKERELEKKEEGSIVKVLYKRPMLICFAAIMFVFQFSYAQYSFTLPLQLGELFHDNGAKTFGLLACVNAFVVIFCTPFMTKLTQRMKPLLVIAFGGALYFVSFTSFGLINSVPLFIISIIIMTLGEINISINLGTYVANCTPATHRGRVNGVIPLIYGCGYAFGPMVMGKFISSFGINKGWIFIGSLMFVATILMCILYFVENQKKRRC